MDTGCGVRKLGCLALVRPAQGWDGQHAWVGVHGCACTRVVGREEGQKSET